MGNMSVSSTWKENNPTDFHECLEGFWQGLRSSWNFKRPVFEWIDKNGDFQPCSMSNGLLFIIHFKTTTRKCVFFGPEMWFFSAKTRTVIFACPEKKLRNDVKIRNVGNPVKKCGGFPAFYLKVHQNLHQNSIWCLFVRQCLKARVASFFRCFNRKSMLEVDVANRYGKTMVWEKNTPFHSKKK